MLFTFDDAARADALVIFARDTRWQDFLDDAESRRWWSVFRDEPEVAMVCNGDYAVVELALRDGRITDVKMLEPADAERAIRTWAFRTPPELARRIGRELARGRRFADALAALSDHHLWELVAPAGVRRLRVPFAGVVEVPVEGDDRVGDPVRWLEGGEAFEATRAGRRR